MIHQTVKVSSLIITGLNPRAIDEKSETFKLLCQTVQCVGVKITPHVVPHGSVYKVVDGERRLRAAKACGLKEIAVLICTDEEAAGVMHLANCNRKALTLFEQVKSIAQLKKENEDSRWLADQLAVTEQNSKLLINIADNLSDSWMQLLHTTQEGWNGWTLAMLALIAKQATEIQNELAYLYEDSYLRARASISSLKGEIDEYQCSLSSMPWPLDHKFTSESYTLASGEYNVEPVCDTCLNRSDQKKVLFAEIKNDKKALCLNAGCYIAKMEQWIQLNTVALLTEHTALYGVFPKGTGGIPWDYDDKQYVQFVTLGYTATVAKKTAKDAKAGIYLSGRSTGKLVWITISKAANKVISKSDQKKKPAKQKTLAEKMAGLETKRWYGTIAKALEKLYVLHYDALPETMTTYHIERMAVLFGIRVIAQSYDVPECVRLVKDYLKTKDEITDQQARLLWGRVKDTLAGMLKLGSVMADTSKEQIVLCKLICDEVGIAWKTIYDQVITEKGFTVPKSWTK